MVPSEIQEAWMGGNPFVETVGAIVFVVGIMATVALLAGGPFWWGPIALIVGAVVIIKSGGSLFY